MSEKIEVLGPDKDSEYWQTYDVLIDGVPLYNLRTKHWPNLVSKEGIIIQKDE